MVPELIKKLLIENDIYPASTDVKGGLRALEGVEYVDKVYKNQEEYIDLENANITLEEAFKRAVNFTLLFDEDMDEQVQNKLNSTAKFLLKNWT